MNDHIKQEKCEICGKTIYPTYGWIYKIRQKNKNAYFCGYTHFREKQKEIMAHQKKIEIERAEKPNRGIKVYELNKKGEIIQIFPSINQAFEEVRALCGMCTFRKNLKTNEDIVLGNRKFKMEKREI